MTFHASSQASAPSESNVGAFASDFRSTLIGRVFVARWFRVPREDSLEALLTHIVAASKQRPGPLLYCAYLRSDAEVLDAKSRRLLAVFEPKILQHCEAIHIVFAGSGTVLKMLLTARRAVNILMAHRSSVFMHTSLNTFLDAAAEHLGGTKGAVAAQSIEML